MRRVQPRQRSNMNRQFKRQFIGNSWQFICFSAIHASTDAAKSEKQSIYRQFFRPDVLLLKF